VSSSQDEQREAYAKAFLLTRFQAAFNRIDAGKKGHLTAGDLLSTPLHEHFGAATQKKVDEMVFELDETCTGQLSVEAVCGMMRRGVLSKQREPGTGSNALQALLEFYMFDANDNGFLDEFNIRQMLYIYFAFTGGHLDEKLGKVMRAVSHEKGQLQLSFPRFYELINGFKHPCKVPHGTFSTEGKRGEEKPQAVQEKRPKRAIRGAPVPLLHMKEFAVVPPGQPKTGRPARRAKGKSQDAASGSSTARSDQQASQAQIKELRFRQKAARMKDELGLEEHMQAKNFSNTNTTLPAIDRARCKAQVAQGLPCGEEKALSHFTSVPKKAAGHKVPRKPGQECLKVDEAEQNPKELAPWRKRQQCGPLVFETGLQKKAALKSQRHWALKQSTNIVA